MPTPILMPALSPTMTEGNLAKWLKNEGDAVRSGDVIAEIETDKATMEVEAVDEGTLGKILVPEGTADVAVNTPIAVLLGDGEDASAIKAGAPAARPAAAAPREEFEESKAPDAPASEQPQETGEAFSAVALPPEGERPDPSFLAILSFSKPFDPAKVRAAYLAGVKPQTVAGKDYYEIPGSGLAVHFPNNQALVFSDGKTLPRYLGWPAKADGKLAGALQQAAAGEFGTAAGIAFALLTRGEFSMGAADPLGKDAPRPLPERRHARRCAWRHRAGRAVPGERLRSLRRRRQCLGVDQRLVPPRLLRLCTEQYCSRCMVGTRGKSEPSTGTNHPGFRLVMDPVPAAAAR